MNLSPAPKRPLAGRVVALPETRELDRLADLLVAEGARAWRCPLVAILDAPDPTPVEAWLRDLVAGQIDDVVFLTGEGLRRLIALAERRGFAAEVVAALARVRKITRGPKPARALKELGLPPDIAAAIPTSQGIMDELARLDLRGRRVGVQLYGEEPNHELCRFVVAAGAVVRSVAPYIYAPASDSAQVAELIREMANGGVDVIAFTSASQVDRLCEVARLQHAESTLLEGWRRVRVAAIGPIAAATLRQHGVEPTIVPQKSYVMKRLVSAIVASIGTPIVPSSPGGI